MKAIYSSSHGENTDPRFVKLEPVFRGSKLKSGGMQRYCGCLLLFQHIFGTKKRKKKKKTHTCLNSWSCAILCGALTLTICFVSLVHVMQLLLFELIVI